MADEETLDPDDWEEIRRVFHSAADRGLAHMRDVRERPVWQPTPEAIQERFRERLPRDGQPVGNAALVLRRRHSPVWHRQHASPLLGLGARQRQRRRRAGRNAGRVHELQRGRTRPHRHLCRAAGRRLVEGDVRISGHGQRHPHQRNVDGNADRAGGGTGRQGRCRRAEARRGGGRHTGRLRVGRGTSLDRQVVRFAGAGQ